MSEKISIIYLIKRFFWDLADKNVRVYYGYWFISQIPGLFGNNLRGRYLSKRFKSSGSNLNVSPGVRFRSIENLIVGDNVEIGYDNFIQALGGVTIGNNVMLAPGVKIWSVNHNYKDKSRRIQDQELSLAPVTLGNDIWISSNAFIAPGVNLPDGVVVGAGAVVGIKQYPPYSIIAGNPARVIGKREDLENTDVEKSD
ncbi:MAG: acyltransferase [Candidatus Thiodiazotropha sp.]